jgi:hypothetical protein
MTGHWRVCERTPIFADMDFFGRMSPLRAYRDLRQFLAGRESYELVFLMAAMLITGFFIYAFARDSAVEPTYKRDIVYVEQWTADRTDAQIRAQQAIDAPIKAKLLAEQKAAQERRQAGFKKMDDAMSRWGL